MKRINEHRAEYCIHKWIYKGPAKLHHNPFLICPGASTDPGTIGIRCLTLVLGSLPSTSSVHQKHPEHDIYNPKLWCFLRYQTAALTEGHLIYINLAGVTLLLPALLAPQARPCLHYELPLLSGQNLNFLFRCKYFKSRTDHFLFLRAIFTLFLSYLLRNSIFIVDPRHIQIHNI